MIVTNAHLLVALDLRIVRLYAQVADLEQRNDVGKSEKNIARSTLLWQAVLLRRRREGLPRPRSIEIN
jgi:hypothetical protein